MALDISKARAMLAKVNSKSGNPLVFKPAAGDNRVRILPLASKPDELPFIELYFHNLLNKTYLSPLSYGQRDPIAEFSDALVSEGGMTKEEFKEAKKLSPYKRTFLPVVERGKENEGVKYWGFGLNIMKDILALYSNEEYGDISDVVNGVDIIINFTPQDKSDTTFAKTAIVAARKSTPLHTDPAVVKSLTTNQPDLLASFDKWTFEQLESVRDAYIASIAGSVPATTQAQTPEPVSLKTDEEVQAEVAATDDEFDKVFNS